MATTSDKQYKLYALPPGGGPEDAEYYFLLPEIDLVYTQNKPGIGMEVTNPEQIPAQARLWLAETINEIAQRYLSENEEALLEGSKTFLDRFREELEKEKRSTGRKKTVRLKVRAEKHVEK